MLRLYLDHFPSVIAMPSFHFPSFLISHSSSRLFGYRLHDQPVRRWTQIANGPARREHERRRRPRVERWVVCVHDADPGHPPYDRSARALRDDRVAHCNSAERVEVAVPMRGDHARPAVARKRTSDHMSRAGSELVVTYALDHDLIAAQARDDHARQ